MTITLPVGWTQHFSTYSLNKWCKEQNISAHDWSFAWSITARIWFRHEEDAVAFRLKFGL